MASPRKNTAKRSSVKPVYTTGMGAMYCGQSDDLLKHKDFSRFRGSAQLIFTSPPFPLNTKKEYGNRQGSDYVNWLSTFAPILKDVLTPDGSIVMEIGNAWARGEPVMSTDVMRALLNFLDAGSLHLCQEFIWYNPARLPAPVQWVNVERTRVKDAFTRIWWMSPTTRPKADNRRILRDYSPSMKRLIEKKKYNPGKRPSHHVIGQTSFFTNNGGAIPPNVIGGDDLPTLSNLLKGTNTRSSERYQTFCREHGLPLHPARMPSELAEFFIKFLTEEGDLVVDPFAGSNTTGAVAESIGRRWLSFERRADYALSSRARFSPDAIKSENPPQISQTDQLSSSPPRTSPALTS